MLQSTTLLSSSLAALSLKACSSSLRYSSTTVAAAAGNATTTTITRRRRSRKDVVVDESAGSSSTSSTSTSSTSSSAAASSPDAWRASLPDEAPATALAAALRRSLSLSGTKPESALVFVAERVLTAEDAKAAFDAAAALRAAKVERGQRGELRRRAHAALTSAAVRAVAAEIESKRGGPDEAGAEAAVSELLSATLGKARQAGMPVGAKTFSDAAWQLQRALKSRTEEEGESTSAATPPVLASAARGVLAASLSCRVKPTPRLAAALINASAVAGGEKGAGVAKALAEEFEANGVRLSPFAKRALERAAAAAPVAADEGKGGE